MTALAAHGLAFAYGAGFSLAVPNLTLEVGEMVALLGPNGSGKTTLMRLLSGVLPAHAGEARLLGGSIRGQSRKAVARQLAVVPQSASVPFAFTVREIATLGRTAYARLLRDETPADREAVSRALRVTQLTALAEHRFDELSGGEQQRVLLAMALAQEPRVLLLDEPTAHLDIAFQVQTLDLVQRLNQTERITVLAAMHDLNLAALYFPRLLLMRHGRIVADGPPATVLTVDAIREVYGAETVVERHPTHGVPQVLARPGAPA
ncbi:MAG TPA: ABC transporter ATP-binding protein [Chloroflexota bacterium]